MDFYDLECCIYERESLLESWLMEGQNFLRVAPEGGLVIHRGGNRIRYYVNDANGRRYLRKGEEDRIRALAQKSYWENIIRLAENELDALSRLKSSPALRMDRPEDYYYQLEEDRQALISPIYWSDSDFVKHWLAPRKTLC